MPYKDIEDRKEYIRLRYEKTANWIRDYKIQMGCKDCGYNAHHAALEFDHIEDRVQGTVSSLAGNSLKAVQKEILLCEVVCRNCHGIRTFVRGKYGPKKGRDSRNKRKLELHPLPEVNLSED